MKPMYLSLLGLLVLSTPVFAESMRQDNSPILVYAFLGMCGLIVLIQAIPPILVAMGFIKGLNK